MGLFNLFGKGRDNASSVSLPVVQPVEAEEKVESATVAPENRQMANKPLTVSYATGWPIDVVYGYLHKNYEDKGFQDAMLECDLAFKDMNLRLIRNKILMVLSLIHI